MNASGWYWTAAWLEEQADGRRSRFGQDIGTGELVGVLAFFSGGVNESNVRCVADSRLAVVPRAIYDALLNEAPDLWRRIQAIGLKRMREVQLSLHLDRLFGPFGIMLPYVLQDLQDDIEWISLRSGEVLYRKGDEASGAYVLMAGRLQMTTGSSDGREIVSDSVLAGETVGEVALLTGKPQSHTVYAARDSELVRLSNYSFELMLKRNTRAIHNIGKILGERLADRAISRDPSRTPISCISLIPAGPDSDLTAFSQSLEAELRHYGPTVASEQRLCRKRTGQYFDLSGR